LVVVELAARVADDVLQLRLASPDGQPLPRWTPGSHIDVECGSLEMTRQYSLCGDLPRHSTMSDSGPPCCPLCRGSAEPGWLCEDHPDKPWQHDRCGGAGIACVCNPQAQVL
jgi:hypothetical protein